MDKVDNFLIKEEITHSIESLSVVSLSKSASINVKFEGIPDKLNGDLQKVKLAI